MGNNQPFIVVFKNVDDDEDALMMKMHYRNTSLALNSWSLQPFCPLFFSVWLHTITWSGVGVYPRVKDPRVKGRKKNEPYSSLTHFSGEEAVRGGSCSRETLTVDLLNTRTVRTV